MLVLDIKRLCRERGIVDPLRVLKKAGYTISQASWRLRAKRNRITFEELERLCIAFHCRPSQLFVWYPPAHSNLPDDHPLQQLKAPPEDESISAQLQKMTPEEIDELKSFLSDMRRKRKGG